MKLNRLIAAALLLIAGSGSATAQSLTAEQQAKLNSLPPSLRAQAMEELRKLNVGSTATPQSKPLEQPEVVEIAEQLENERITGEFQQGQMPEEGEDQGDEENDYAKGKDFQSKRLVDQELKQYGYELFSGSPTTFAPVTEIPIPVDYLIGPGDQVRIQLFGKETNSYDLYVTREGILQIPQLGPLAVAGQTFQELKANISRRVADQMIGMEAFVTLGELRSIRVFLLGDVRRPGSYTVSSLSTLTNALFVSGGIKTIGSLRNIQLKRAGTTIATLDLYDLLLRGDTSKDAGLQPGDVIFVPTVGPLVGVGGEVRRPAIYELKGEETVDEVIEMAGGLTPQAYPSISQIERLADSGLKKLIDIDLTQKQNLLTEVENGDTLRIYSALKRVENYVRLVGSVERPGDYAWVNGIRVSDIIASVDQLQPDADLNYALVVSKNPINGRWSTRSFSPEALFLEGNDEHNLFLDAEDRIYVFDDTKEERVGLDKIIDRLKAQGTSSDPQRVVRISGRVRHPGEYPLDQEMTVSDLLRAAGGYTEDAYTLEAELLRYQDNGKQLRDSVLIPINLAQLASSDNVKVSLEPFDQLTIKSVPEWTERETIEIEGEVRFPGTYSIERGETLAEVLERAGGLTNLAHPPSAVFLRESLRLAESENLAKLRERLQGEIANASLQRDEFSVDSIDTAQTLLEQLESTKAVGRLVINLPEILAGQDNLRVRDGDKLTIPQRPQAVTIIGSVNYPTSHIYQPNLSKNEYIDLSGGLMRNADKRQIYVVRANGRVEAERRSRFFPNGGLEIFPGDTIVVPVDVDRMHPLKYWGVTSQIFYQMALGAAAINSF